MMTGKSAVAGSDLMVCASSIPFMSGSELSIIARLNGSRLNAAARSTARAAEPVRT